MKSARNTRESLEIGGSGPKNEPGGLHMPSGPPCEIGLCIVKAGWVSTSRKALSFVCEACPICVSVLGGEVARVLNIRDTDVNVASA